jgi:hypothetical protein
MELRMMRGADHELGRDDIDGAWIRGSREPRRALALGDPGERARPVAPGAGRDGTRHASSAMYLHAGIP